ncbi:O-antigen ligase family protein [Candidimonas humi]|uniref:O-antigen ligase family protein n=1 Tax=Candidimonas humi TaxID=683355 RepID=A0ABV8P5U1_9BURK|nr:O-antigen ligase family protein [Candidimonas humi]MBV6307088.1 O-antigen ligase family protein [Candidimonas humi]
MDTVGGPLELMASLGAFLFFCLMLAVPSGYSYGAALLLLAGLAYCAQRPALGLSREDRVLAWLLLVNTLLPLAIFLVHGDELKTIDQSSRYVMAIPIMWLCMKHPPRRSWIWAGVALGAIASVGITLWQRHWEGVDRATGFVTSAIPYGDIGLVMAMLCVAALFSRPATGTGRTWPWSCMLGLGVAAGLYSCVASETRGAWIAVPPVAVIFCVAFGRRRDLWRLLGAGLAVVALLAAVFVMMPDKGLKERSFEAVHEVQMYLRDRNSGTSVGARLEMWRMAIENIPKKPVLGWNYAEYEAEVHRETVKNKVDPFVATLANTHNNYLEACLHQGVFGLLVLLALYAYTFGGFCRRLRHPGRNVRIPAVCGASVVVSFFIFGLTQVILGRNNGVLFFLVSLAIFWGSMRHEEDRAQDPARPAGSVS